MPRRDRPRAFTLLESMLVLALIMILLTAVSLNFSGGQSLGGARQAQVTAVDALTTEVQYAAESATNSYTSSVTTLESLDPDITFVSGATASTASQVASLALSSGTAVCPEECVSVAVDEPASTQAGSSTLNTCWYLVRDVAAPLSEMPTVYADNVASSTTNCTGNEGLTLAALPASTSTGQSQDTPYNAAFG